MTTKCKFTIIIIFSTLKSIYGHFNGSMTCIIRLINNIIIDVFKYRIIYLKTLLLKAPINQSTKRDSPSLCVEYNSI